MPRRYRCCTLSGGASLIILARNFAIQNMVATAEMDYGINLELMVYSHARFEDGRGRLCTVKARKQKQEQGTRNSADDVDNYCTLGLKKKPRPPRFPECTGVGRVTAAH